LLANWKTKDGECSQFLDQRKQATMQWLQDPSQSTVDNLNNVRCEAGPCMELLFCLRTMSCHVLLAHLY